MVKVQRYVFVLWGQHCDEAAASIFITELRKTGLLVKLVGVSGQRSAGAHGLTLVPDLMLSEAVPLARQAIGVVIPCASTHLRRFANDPRLGDLLTQSQAQQARLVVREDLDPVTLLALGLSVVHEEAVAIELYPEGESLIAYARALARGLVAASAH
jgi:hypothetical protein